MAENKKSLKIAILDKASGYVCSGIVNAVADRLKVDMVGTQIGFYGTWPDGYDVYLIHLTDVDIEDLEKLREFQPDKWIYGLYRGGDHNTESARKIIDELLPVLTLNNCERIIHRALNGNRV